MNELRDKVARAMISASPQTEWFQGNQWSDYDKEQQSMLLLWADAAIATVQESGWQDIAAAKADGAVIIARYKNHPEFGSWAMLRSVQWDFDQEGKPLCRDLGGWLVVRPLEPNFDEGEKVGGNPLRIPLCYHADSLNTRAPLEWMPLPPPPFEGTKHD